MGSSTPKQYVILSLPSAGSDWLADVIRQSSGLRYYHKEFFNPLTNPNHSPRLSDGFGCELVGCYQNIAAPWKEHVEELDNIYAETWDVEDYDFDKEVFSPFKVGWYARHFQVVVLVRSEESVFPPVRLRVWQWYEAIWQSIAHLFQAKPQGTIVAHALCGYKVALSAITDDAAELHIPVLRYDDLVNLPEADLREHFAQGWIADVVDVDRAVAMILDTRHQHGSGKPSLSEVLSQGRFTVHG